MIHCSIFTENILNYSLEIPKYMDKDACKITKKNGYTYCCNFIFIG